MENVLVKVENKDGILVVSSNQVAVELGIRHDNYWIKLMIMWRNLTHLNFQGSSIFQVITKIKVENQIEII